MLWSTGFKRRLLQLFLVLFRWVKLQPMPSKLRKSQQHMR
jgi:hypothetical protein